MPGPVASRASLRTLAFAAVAVLPILALCACGSDPGTTPACNSDVTANGIMPTPGGCNGFAECKDTQGQVVKDPMQVLTVCCADAKGSDMELCLFLYGAGPAPNNFGGGSGGGSSSSSSSSGMKDGG